nr:glycoside hydrolase domain-containing protein [Paenibacillus dendritiformis]
MVLYLLESRRRVSEPFLDFPLLKTRYLHWGNYLYGLDGYLHWGFNYYFADQDPMELTNPLLAPDVHDRRVPAGDTHIVYPGDGVPLLSTAALPDLIS